MSGPPDEGSGSGVHSADTLIREIILTIRTAGGREVEVILDRMASAPFNSLEMRVPRRDRGHAYQGQTLGDRADSLTYHLVKRVVIEQQWAPGTTSDQYVEDLHRAVRDPQARLAVYAYGSDFVASTLTSTARAVPSARFGARPERLILVIYSAVRGALTTG
jgi:hypothetical protein